MPKNMVKGQTVQTGEWPQTNGRTHTHTHTNATKRIIAPAMRSIITSTLLQPEARQPLTLLSTHPVSATTGA